MEDVLIIGIDVSKNDHVTVLSVMRRNGGKTTLVNTLYNVDAMKTYEHLINDSYPKKCIEDIPTHLASVPPNAIRGYMELPDIESKPTTSENHKNFSAFINEISNLSDKFSRTNICSGAELEQIINKEK